MGQKETGSRVVLDSLYTISSLVSETEDPHEALDLILDEVVRLFGANSASISLINPDTNKLELEVHKGLFDTKDEGFSLPLGHGITGWVALHGKHILVNDVTEEQRYLAINPAIRSELAVPMISEGSTIGVVNIDSERVAAFNEDDVKSLTLLTNEATRVVSRLWLINQLKDQSRQRETLLNIGQQLVRKLELQEVLDSITEQSLSFMLCRICAIFLLNDDGDTLHLKSLAGTSGKLDYAEDFNLYESSVGAAINRKKQVQVLELQKTEEHHFIRLTEQEGLVSMLATPIILEGEVIGVLNAYTDRIHRFNNDEKKTFSTLATMGAVAIQNTRLYSRVFTSEESLRKNERLTTLGLLAAEIAHEIRNPLTVIKLLFDALDLDFPDGDARKQDVNVIQEKIKQLEEIVGNVLNFGKSNVELHSRHRLSSLIDDTLRLIRLKLKQSKIEIHYKPSDTPVYVEVHKGQIQQVLLNLMLNAVQAMPKGGLIEVDVYQKEENHSKRGIVRVKDCGSGIPDTVSRNIFESFLTSKKDGTGLGLAISKRIMRSHRGDIELIESTSKGTVFEFSLPVVEKP